ncbi:hypothetical protein [Hoeflea sp. AS16]|uniref:hypothetical protein n=1 Tax=unclassified Hoeflea TaxID=2614931 RepID=UPI00316E69DD
MLNAASQIHFDQVDRHFLKQQRDHVGVSSDEIVELLGSMVPLGVWRLEIETGLIYWSEDCASIHLMEASSDPVSLAQVLARYHPEDAILVEQVLGKVTTEHNSFRMVLRVEDGKGSYRLVATAGRYREDNGGELIGYCHEYQDMVRAVILSGE